MGKIIYLMDKSNTTRVRLLFAHVTESVRWLTVVVSYQRRVWAI